MLQSFLVEKTVAAAKGDGPPLEVTSAQSRVFLLTLAITNIVEQESLELSIFTSPDGTTWDAKPAVSFPQKFYRGETPLLLDLRARPEVRCIRAHWEVNRWGRGSETPMFEFHVAVREVPPDVLQEAVGRVP